MPAMQAREIRRFVVFLGVFIASVFLPAGTLAWRNGWLFVAVICAAVASVSFGIFRASPELARERRTAAKNAKPWDRVLVPWITGLPLVTVVLAGLGRRFGWMSVVPPWTTWPAVALMVAGSALAYLAMRTNRFFSSYVRIQSDRDHVVVDRGPYAFVRHPGYAGSVAVALATPILLDSLPGLAVAAVTILLTVVRTYLEDRTLAQELPNYRAYSERVRFRLLPWVW
jgi:protein-S-isoprenylcysteine O-methyltransferase Ste14